MMGSGTNGTAFLRPARSDPKAQPVDRNPEHLLAPRPVVAARQGPWPAGDLGRSTSKPGDPSIMRGESCARSRGACRTAMPPNWWSPGLNPEDLPACLYSDLAGPKCPECPYWEKSTCPLAGDADWRSFIKWGVQRRHEAQRRAEARIQVLLDILATYGAPLHWEVLAAMVQAARPDLFTTPRAVRVLLARHPAHFAAFGGGVYSRSIKR